MQAAVAAATVLALEHGGIARVDGGGVAQGLSHKQGGIPLYYRGRAAGIEIEGGEPVLTKGVAANPLLLSMASAINQLAGGRALAPNLPAPHMALGGVTQPLVLQQLSGANSGVADSIRQLGEKIERMKIYTKTQETMASIEKVKYAQAQSSH